MRSPSRSALRPSMPLTVPLASAWWISSALAFSAATRVQAQTSVALAAFGILCAIASTALLVVVRKRPVARVVLMAAVGCAVGASGGMLRSATLEKQGAEVAELAPGTYRIEASADSRMNDFGPSCVVDLQYGEGKTAAVILRYPSETGVIRYATAYEADLRFSELSGRSLETYRKQGVVAVATAGDLQRVERNDIREPLVTFRENAIELFDGYQGQGASFLKAILLGDRSGLEDEGFYQKVKTIGLAHIVAVSGAHLSIVCALLGIALVAVRIPRRVAVAVQALFVVAYLCCTGMPISGVRAAIMTAVALSAVYAKRRSSSIGALALCVCCVLAASTEAAVSISFALSVLATVGIVVFGSLARDWCLTATGGRFSLACNSVALTVSSGVLTMPLSAAVFAQLPLISPVSNLYALPFFTAFCGGGLLAVAACSVAPYAFRWMLDILVVGAEGFCGGIGFLASAPIVSVPCSVPVEGAIAASVAAAVLLWRVWPRPSKRVAAIALSVLALAVAVAAFVPLTNHEDEIIMLDVGQGDAFVIRSKGSSVLVDTGNQDTKLLSALARNGVYALDAVVISHPDDDHCASLAALEGTVRVKSLFVASDLLECGCDACFDLKVEAASLVGEENVLGLSVGDALHVGSMELSVVWPDGFADEGGNADSLCLLVGCDADGDQRADWTGLLCGDAENAQVDAMITAGRVGKIDIYKVGHHGSKAALDAETASVLAPSIALVSVGEGNRYGHPAAQTLSVLEEAGSAIYRTDIAGDVVCRMTPDAIEVETLR